ncbi:MAG: carbamoyltransferase HypF [Gemmatimonadota bacterium]|nr:carbamoyltransferase HypF [Gemmatimonadota bacterium]
MIAVGGTVQGVGFRPYVHRLATARNLSGFVRNDSAGLTIDVQGDPHALEDFLSALIDHPPPTAVVERVKISSGPVRPYRGFEIAASAYSTVSARTNLSPDIAVCDECLRELFDPDNRRHRYPFINCTHCGPRFTIIDGVPYDRALTTMRVFEMCGACRGEYENPADRRFHAQPVACAECGPSVRLIDAKGSECEGEAMAAAARMLAQGHIVAVKGLGGYHLACDSMSLTAIERLRYRKAREAKPFAVMVRDIAALGALCLVTSREEALLLSRERPIVLLRKRHDLDGGAASAMHTLAPGNPCLGIMLAYTPLHHLLLAEFGGPLVLTSGNIGDEPIAFEDADAFDRLGAVADFFLTHDRAIAERCDDSVMRVMLDKPTMLRRSRGFVPSPIDVGIGFPAHVLAVGGQLKNTFCCARDNSAFLSQHIGDLDHTAVRVSLANSVARFSNVVGVKPEVVVHDLHPQYASTEFALDVDGVERIGVQHHHAHIASCMAEHGIVDPVIGVAFDGTGYGTDGAIWGGEFLVVDEAGFRRAAHLRYVPIPGGEAAIRRPLRMAVSHLISAYGDDAHSLPLELFERAARNEVAVVEQIIAKGLASLPTSSIGRLFDVVAALLGVRDDAQFEGQPAMELEAMADPLSRRRYEFSLSAPTTSPCSGAASDTSLVSLATPLQIDPAPVVRSIVDDVLAGVDRPAISGAFHNSVADMILKVAELLRIATGISEIALSGGVFQNVLLTTRASQLLAGSGFDVYTQRLVPCNDGGLSLGQAYVVALGAHVPSRKQEPTAELCA